MRELETRIPPPIVMVLLGGIAWMAAKFLPALSFQLPAHTLFAGALAAVGLVLNVLPKLALKHAGTTVNPLKPASTTSLVTSGIYRHTRNPMYLGHSVILLGWAAHLHNLVAFLAVPAFMLYISRFQIQPEERELSARFPDAYAAFSRQVPRWL
jgi:protein-S-isoprenylcysteine O-methyltransferase Ste14